MAKYRKPSRKATVFTVDGRAERQQLLKEGMMHLCLRSGIRDLAEMMRQEAEEIAGPKSKKIPGRRAHHWGSEVGTMVLGGRKIRINHPRVRSAENREIPLQTYAEASRQDLMEEHVLEGILCGLATRTFGRFESGRDDCASQYGTSRSAVSRRLIQGTEKRLAQLLSRPLDKLILAALFIDGVHMGEHTIIVALGLDFKGKKHVLGLAEGSTENSAVAKSLLDKLIERGLDLSRPLLSVIDGGKGIHKALTDVMGKSAPIQRCRIHKERNIQDHLPRELREWVKWKFRKAWEAEDAKTAKDNLLALARSLEEKHPGAAGSIREGLDELLTVIKLKLPAGLRRMLSSTNVIENMFSRLRKVTGQVRRWRGGLMAMRWAATAVLEAEHGFNKASGHRELPFLATALNKESSLISSEKAA